MASLLLLCKAELLQLSTNYEIEILREKYK